MSSKEFIKQSMESYSNKLSKDVIVYFSLFIILNSKSFVKYITSTVEYFSVKNLQRCSPIKPLPNINILSKLINSYSLIK